MRKILTTLMLLLGLLALGPLAMPAAAQQQDQQLPPEVQQLLDSLRPQHGQITISEADATLDLGDQYDFYGPDDARRILVDLWGNHPDEASDVLGLVMPAGASPISDSWAAVVTYEDTGWVSNDDADDADYDDLMEQMQDASADINEQRRGQGYPGVEIIGWAQAPHYDAASHSVVWARELQFDGEQVRTLNYDLRTLGRRGVLSLNLVSTMPQLAGIQTAAADFATHASFNPGARYEDYDESTDRAAGYGIAGLVAGGAGLALAKKAGILALLLKFIKPILIGIVVFFGAFWRKVKSMFGFSSPPAEDWQDYEDQAPEAPADPPDASLPEDGRGVDLPGSDRPPPGP
ncbi:MAG: DUF2167 domain-containing protein [Erythrobacter sp.]|nr:DUF2167 domain-containing protein [Erythrobacter sp.]